MPLDPTNYMTLSAMITPAFFLTANGSLIISTSNRMARIIDRTRVLNDLSDRLDRGVTDLDYPAERYEQARDLLVSQLWRSDRIRYALTMLYVSFSSFVGASLATAVDIVLENKWIALPTSLAVAGVCVMLAACVNMVREALEALRSNRREIAYSEGLRARRRADREAQAADQTTAAPG